MIRLPDAFLTTPLAHRGFHGEGRPENSLEAFEAAMSAGYGIELDVQGTADGHAVVFHDDTLDRMTDETGPVRHRTLEQMTQIPLLGSGRIIELGELVRLVDGRVPLLIEIKDQSGQLGTTDGRLEKAVAEATKGAKNVAVMSFNPEAVAGMRDLSPDLPRGLVTERFDASYWTGADAETLDHLTAIRDYDRVGASFISHNRKHLNDPRVGELISTGADVLCWTVRSSEEEAEARQIARNITFEGYAAPIPGG